MRSPFLQRQIAAFIRLALKSLFAILLAVGFSARAQAQITFGPSQPASSSDSEIRELNWMNHTYLDKQRRLIDGEIRKAVGRQLNQGRNDIRLIQRAIDKGAFQSADKQTLQALGVALGDVFAAEHKKLNWRVYEDELGASHAICLEDTSECLFPMTMLSRRMEAGLTPDVSRIFNTNLESIKRFMPYVPYSRDYSKDLPKNHQSLTEDN